MPINHSGHDHPATPAGRAACRKGMSGIVKGTTHQTVENVTGDRKPAKIVKVQPVGRGSKRTTPRIVSGNIKKPGTLIKTIGDLPNVPQMLAYATRLAWGNDWEVGVGEPFNDEEARIVIKAPKCEISLVWKVSMPFGIWGIFVRNWNSSVTSRVNSIQEGMDAGQTEDAWDGHGRHVGL